MTYSVHVHVDILNEYVEPVFSELSNGFSNVICAVVYCTSQLSNSVFHWLFSSIFSYIV